MSTQVEISKKELQKLSYNFRIVTSRLLNTSVEQSASNLRRFLDFVRNHSIIYDFISKHQTTQYDISLAVNEANQGWGLGEYQVPDQGQAEEISFTYQLLSHILEECFTESNQGDGYVYFAMGYAGKKFQQKIDRFAKEVISPFVQYVESYLRGLIIDAGEDDNNRVSITFFEGNIMNHSSDIRATNIGFVQSGDGTISHFSQTIGQNMTEITSLINSLREVAQRFPEALREDALVHLEDLEEDLSKPEKRKPQKIKTPFMALLVIAGTVAGIVASATDFSNNVLELANKFEISLELSQPLSNEQLPPSNTK